MDTALEHASVLLPEALDALVTDPDGRYIDATFGRGGHTRALLARLSPRASVLAIDRDPDAVSAASVLQNDQRFTIERGEFGAMSAMVAARGWAGSVNGVLLDLGVSSPQLDRAERGFSFLHDGPLDMRMNPDQGSSAAQWLAQASREQIAQVLRDYGEERYAWRIAGAIIEARDEQAIVRTGQLSRIVREANPAWEKGKHPATRSFQGIRIFINNELGELEAALAAALESLAVGGRLVVISFHSLEDRMVKRFFRDQARGNHVPRSVPIIDAQMGRRVSIIGKPLKPSEQEVAANPRARSAVLRVAQKLA
jgi:16S rRNA (cytosine1402-N4)-methyltransferase